MTDHECEVQKAVHAGSAESRRFRVATQQHKGSLSRIATHGMC